MTNFFGDGPLFVGGWMDSGPLYHFSEAPGPLALAALAVPLLIGLWTRTRELVLFGGAVLLGSIYLMGLFLPLGLWGGSAIVIYVVAAISFVRGAHREAFPPLLLGGIVLATAVSLGFPRSYVHDSTVCRIQLKSISTALEMWATDHEEERPDSLEQLEPRYLPELPRCRNVPYAYERPVAWCQNPQHQRFDGVPPGYPRLAEDGSVLDKPPSE